MNCIVKWTTEVRGRTVPVKTHKDSLIPLDVGPEITYSSVYYKGHDGIGHQWTDAISLAKEFYSDSAAEEIIELFAEYNYDGVFCIEESIRSTIDSMSTI